MNTIGVFVTGGTFDKDYNLINGNLGFQQTHVPEMFKRGRSTLDIDSQVLMMIDIDVFRLILFNLINTILLNNKFNILILFSS